jgi:hypothetical protein
MSNVNDFEIKNGVLVKYHGNDTEVVIPEGVTGIGKYAFCNCNSLTNITIPPSVTEIGGWAFNDCSLLTSITISEGVTRIGGAAFYDCSSLTNITIPEGVTEIGERAFYRCRSLKNITIPESVTEIGEYVFSDCRRLEKVVVLGDAKCGKTAFNDCNALKTVIAPKARVRHSATYYRGFWEGFELFDKKKRASYIKGMLSHQDVVVEAVGGDGESFKNFIDRIKPEGELFDFLLDITTSQGKTELTALLLEYGNSNGNPKSPIDDLEWK